MPRAPSKAKKAKKARAEKATKAACKAREKFKDRKGGPCVTCACEDDPTPECRLFPYRPNCCKARGMTPHHVIPAHCFMPPGARKAGSAGLRYKGCEKYKDRNAPCICVKGRSKVKTHAKVHDVFDPLEDGNEDKTWTYEEARDAGAASVHSAMPNCTEECIKAQLDDYHQEQADIGDKTKLRAESTGRREQPKLKTAKQAGDGF